ncbi:S-adenosyl-L-methionine-dependent methyltransferases superfamily protein, putative isoform 1 [Hibiscus syriacus]|uniref:S-adenosyl-L-methionine-dependent methyltransferases superfamily protein, putative isoform 1 n=1 Tax=Hibiscus syriacus TaxID=106335 RepID=A0A6A3CVR6_HIBSY|nr:uncharacterized protein LOC120123029 [Hibiscus syriacus]KAE8733665.1 S-adenosyl-L-methionine-dependent methyltransferases superfamily protein, putative isoform 1 [Hibiscus syriacus]
MASACVNNIGVSPDSFQRYGWLGRRMSLSREVEPSKTRPKTGRSKPTDLVELEIQETAPAGDFEFRLEDPVAMLPADELFSNGKLLPLHFSTLKQQQQLPSSNTRSLKTAKSFPTMEMDPYLFSPRAPRCSSRWRELLGLKKSSQNTNQQHPKTESQGPKSLKHFLHRTTKSSSSLNLPLLRDSDCESVSISSSRLSLSSSSSGHEHEDLPRLSLDSDKPSPNPFAPCRNLNPNPNPTRAGRCQIRRDSSTSRGISVDSPRMSSSGRIVFQSLERSSSSPSSFNGGPKIKQRGMERSHSGNVRITPVLNVPVCSLRGSSKSGLVFGLFSSSQQKTANGGSNSKGRQCNSRS